MSVMHTRESDEKAQLVIASFLEVFAKRIGPVAILNHRIYCAEASWGGDARGTGQQHYFVTLHVFQYTTDQEIWSRTKAEIEEALRFAVSNITLKDDGSFIEQQLDMEQLERVTEERIFKLQESEKTVYWEKQDDDEPVEYVTCQFTYDWGEG